MWFFSRKRKKKNHGFIVLKKSFPKYYGLCGREIITHRIPMNAHDFVLQLDAYFDYGYELDRIELPT